MTVIIDVVIPVYNAPELTRRCIDSVITHLGTSIRFVHIQNDASDAETREMLDNMQHAQLRVYHAAENQGYGKSVNDAVARSTADLVFVLNSDTEIRDNFLPLLCHALDTNPKLAVISPTEVSPVTGTTVESRTQSYMRQPGGYIATYRLRGYAYLMRRKEFQELGGLDLAFGRGYYEDVDLGRRLINQGWCLGEHPDAIIYHRTSASFGRGNSRRELVKKNRTLYFSRYPSAKHNVLLVSGTHTLTEFSGELKDAIEQVFQQGGGVHWLSASKAPLLYCLHMRNSAISMVAIARLLILRNFLRDDKRISMIWILPDVSIGLRTLLRIFVRIYKLQLREWD